LNRAQRRGVLKNTLGEFLLKGGVNARRLVLAAALPSNPASP
jgi:hypothetical protein